MPRPRRFNNAYGYHTMSKSGWSQYRVWRTNGNHGGWTGSEEPTNQLPVIRAARLLPRPSDGKAPTNWGALAERHDAPSFDYRSKTGSTTYQWRGQGDTTTCGVLKVPSSLGAVTASASAVVVSVPSAVSAAATNAAKNNIREQQINLSVAFGEMGETIRSLCDVVVRVSRSARHARRGRWRRAAEALNAGSLTDTHAVASSYATYMWAIKPFLADVYGLQEQVKKGLARKGKPIRATGFNSITVPSSACLTGSSSAHRFSGTGGRAFSRVVLNARVHSDTLYALNQLGVANPIATAWELFPLSFVIDWFLPIGDFLNALTGSLGTVFVSGFEDRVIEVGASVRYCRYGWSNFQGGNPQVQNYQFFAFERRTLASFPPSRLYLGAGINNSLSKAISSIALIRLRAGR